MTEPEEINLTDEQLRAVTIIDLTLEGLSDEDRGIVFELLSGIYCFDCGERLEHDECEVEIIDDQSN